MVMSRNASRRVAAAVVSVGTVGGALVIGAAGPAQAVPGRPLRTRPPWSRSTATYPLFRPRWATTPVSIALRPTTCSPRICVRDPCRNGDRTTTTGGVTITTCGTTGGGGGDRNAGPAASEPGRHRSHGGGALGVGLTLAGCATNAEVTPAGSAASQPPLPSRPAALRRFPHRCRRQ